MTEDIVGSKQPTFASEQLQPSNRGFGQNGYGGPSSEPVNTAKKISKTYSGLSGEVDVSAGPGSWQTRTVSAAPIKTNPGTRGAAPGGKVPLSNVRRANDGIPRPTR